MNQPQYRDAAAAIVGRLAMDRIVEDGYLQGEALDASDRLQRYQEGQVGYEQYAARGFAAWGFPPRRALPFRENGLAVTVLGQSLLADFRGMDRLTSDPLILMGLELRLGPRDRTAGRTVPGCAGGTLSTDGTRHPRRRGCDERASALFLLLLRAGERKRIRAGRAGPSCRSRRTRWVSAKAAWAWHAPLPSTYTELVLRRVAPARTPLGWESGVYEASGRSTGTLNLNTAGVILAAALVHARGEPLLQLTGPEGQDHAH